jgi:hypothetical protein
MTELDLVDAEDEDRISETSGQIHYTTRCKMPRGDHSWIKRAKVLKTCILFSIVTYFIVHKFSGREFLSFCLLCFGVIPVKSEFNGGFFLFVKPSFYLIRWRIFFWRNKQKSFAFDVMSKLPVFRYSSRPHILRNLFNDAVSVAYLNDVE